MTGLTDKWCSLEETAEYLGVTKDTIRNWIKKTEHIKSDVYGSLNWQKQMLGSGVERAHYNFAEWGNER